LYLAISWSNNWALVLLLATQAGSAANAEQTSATNAMTPASERSGKFIALIFQINAPK
jgi:hypothetical protein